MLLLLLLYLLLFFLLYLLFLFLLVPLVPIVLMRCIPSLLIWNANTDLPLWNLDNIQWHQSVQIQTQPHNACFRAYYTLHASHTLTLTHTHTHTHSHSHTHTHTHTHTHNACTFMDHSLTWEAGHLLQWHKTLPHTLTHHSKVIYFLVFLFVTI